MTSLAILIAGADPGAVTLLLGVDRDVAERVDGQPESGPGVVLRAAQDALSPVCHSLAHVSLPGQDLSLLESWFVADAASSAAPQPSAQERRGQIQTYCPNPLHELPRSDAWNCFYLQGCLWAQVALVWQ